MSELVLSDLSAAFDTIDHTFLLLRLKDVAGIAQPTLTFFTACDAD